MESLLKKAAEEVLPGVCFSFLLFYFVPFHKLLLKLSPFKCIL